MLRESNITTSRETHSHVKITADDIRALAGAPAGAKVFIHVPGGGDYSSTDLDVDGNEQVVQVQWTVKDR
jgi:hypothetical protein